MRKVTLFTGQFEDMPLAEVAKMAKDFGYDGLELGCGGDHFDPIAAANDLAYCEKKKKFLEKFGLGCWAISDHLAGQMVCDLNDERSDCFAPKELAGNPEGKREYAVERMKDCARAAKNMGIKVVNGFTGSSIWHLLYSFPPVSDKMIEDGFKYFAKMWNPILNVFDKCGVKFALEVHPTEIAFDIVTAKRAIESLKRRTKSFGFNFDPSHLQWQGVDPVRFLQEFPDRIYHVHMKDCAVTLDGRAGILASHLNFGHPERGWDFRSLGRGDVDFEAIIRALNHAKYDGPLSVEWEDSAMDRMHGAREACEFVRNLEFPPSAVAFDAAFGK